MFSDPNATDTPIFCRALYDYKSADSSAFSLRTGDIIQVLTKQPSGWWDGLLYESRGWFPSNYVEIISEEEADQALSRMEISSGHSDEENEAMSTIQPDITLSANSQPAKLLATAPAPLQKNIHQRDFWMPDVASDGHIYYVNTETGVQSVDLPTDAEEEEAETAVLGLRSTRLERAVKLAVVPEEVSAPTIAIREKSNDDEDLNSFYPVVISTPPSLQIYNTSPSFRPLHTHVPDNTLTEVVHDPAIYDTGEQELNQQLTVAFRRAMEPHSSSHNLIHDLSCVAQDAIRRIIDNIQSSIVTLSPNLDQIMDGLVYDVVLAIRNLLHVAAALPVNRISGVSLNSGSRGTRALSLSQPRAHQRRVTAILSRLVLSVRALMYNSGASLGDTGDRIQNDAEELLKDVQNFVHNIESVGETRDSQRNMTAKRFNGIFSVADVDFGLAGGGVAASWKGFGYHKRHDNKVIPLKSLDFEVVLEIELFVEQLQKRSADLRDTLQFSTKHSVNTAEYQVCSMVQALITRTSAFLSFIADIYVAQHVDISGSQQPSKPSGVPEYNSMVTEAAHLVRYLEAVVQAIYDDSSSLLLVTQTQGLQHPTSYRRQYEHLIPLLSSLDKQFLLVKQIFEQLLSLGGQQADAVNDSPNGSNGPIQWDVDDDISTDINQLNDQDVIDLETSFQRLNFRKHSFSGDDTAQTSVSAGHKSGLSGSSLTVAQRETNVSDDRRTIEDVVDREKVTESPSRATVSTKLQKILGDEYAEKLAEDLRPWYLRPNYAPSDIIIDADNSIRGGTLSSLVERLTAHDQADSTFTKAFLLTYKSYTTLDQLFDLLVARFRIHQPEKLTPAEKEEWVKLKQHVIRTRVINTMKAIVDALDQEDWLILGSMKDFLSSKEVSSSAAAKNLLIQIDRLMVQGDAKTLINTNQEPPPMPISPKANKKLQLLDIDPLELARQFTLIESHLYQRIKAMEAWQRARVQKGEHDDNISAVIQMSNQIAEWIAECILSKEDARGRALVIKHLIIVAERCRALNNFSTMSAVISGLNTPPIRRLKRTWEQVNRRHMALFEGCEMVIDSAKTFTKYKSLMTSVVPPCVPFLGVFLSTLQFIQDGNPDFLAPEVVNFRKFQMASEPIIEIKRWQTQPYNLQPLPTVITYINASLNKFSGNARATSDYFWALSLAREPRERDDEKMARLLHESGF